MNVDKLVFRGDITGAGDWYGKVETNSKDNTRTLVLFKRPEERGAAQHMADKFSGTHKGAKLTEQFIADKTIRLLGNLNNKDRLQSFLQTAKHNDNTLNNIAHLIKQQNPTPSGGVNFMAEIRPATGGPSRDIPISWQPDA